jgi:predicted alpha-1,2-mannosidase
MVSAWQKGIRGFDANLAFEGLKKNHLPGGLMSKAGYEHNTSRGGGVDHYIEKGYVPYPLSKKQYGYHQDGAGMTLEYAYQDWCMAQFAQALGKNEDATVFTQRSQSWRNLYNPATGFIQPKDSTGAWKDPFDPLEYDHGFIEGNAAQFTWFVPHDLPGLFELMGGKQKAIDRLNDQFEQSRAHRFCNEHPGNTPRFVNDKRTWINYSNQPNMQAAFLFNHAGAPWLTQYWSREVINAVYSGLTPDTGYYGNEDQGLMGALSVLMKMGLFQMSGGAEADPYYEIGSPIFEGITISLDIRYYPSTSLRITANQVSDQNRYIQSAQLNGKPVQSFRLRHSELLNGGRLILEMGSQPNKTWGVE